MYFEESLRHELCLLMDKAGFLEGGSGRARILLACQQIDGLADNEGRRTLET